MIINEMLHILFRRIRPEKVIRSWLDCQENGAALGQMCLFSEKENALLETEIISAIQNEYAHYTVDEARYAFRYMKDYELYGMGRGCDFGVFGLVAKSVENFLTTDIANECLCRHKEILQFRNLTHPIDPTIFVAAFLAKYDIEHNFVRERFSWSPVVRSDNLKLYHVLQKGMAENHFHIGGSSNAFLFSWICLMNKFDLERKKEFNMDHDPLDTVYTGVELRQESSYLLTFKAVCIRYFLYLRLNGEWAIQSGEDATEDNLRCINVTWLKKIMALTEDDCSMDMQDVNAELEALRKLCDPADSSGFIPDYALRGEPLHATDDDDEPFYADRAVRNYERRLFRPLAGEQRFLYQLFHAIFQKDPAIEPYWDLIYAYLLIYCRLRGELMQTNNRIGFGNFLKYQDRKDIFTERYSDYDMMRTGIAQRVVLENPQVISFEGRFSPPQTPDEFIKKVEFLINCGTGAICGVSDFFAESSEDKALHHKESELRKKLQYVVHFPKKAQPIRDDEGIELLCPRDNIIRDRTMTQADALLKAREMRPNIMGFVTGVDACASEIDCRPEVFACAIRKICEYRQNSHMIEQGLPILHITYHVGEDFLTPLNGLRAVDEAIRFCKMKTGDRLGHALVLGIDCEDWYAQKDYTVLARAQELLDDFVWLYDGMYRFGIRNYAVESEINRQFRRLFAQIYQENQDCGDNTLNGTCIEQYAASLTLRGDDPALYYYHPLKEREKYSLAWSEAEPWQFVQRESGADKVPATLYHNYHYNYKMKKASDTIVAYTVPRCMIKAICDIQEKLLYQVSYSGIAVECNPSSNFLIGTFKDYLKHPIFRFNSKNLFPASDPRAAQKMPYIAASINTDDLGIFDTSLENEYSLMASALEKYNEVCPEDEKIPSDHIYAWLDMIRELGVSQSFQCKKNDRK